MSHPRAFISFDFDNNGTQKLLFSGQAKNSRTPFNIQDWSSKQHLPQSQWENLIKDKISRCNMLIVLVGGRTAGATGVLKEISFAKENDVPVFGVYLDLDSKNTTLPAGLPAYRVISWDWEKIAALIDRCMEEGKNKN
jgi:hypothetical protein